ncbi:VPLPA-CTERM sorting domain-containing protein [Roseobacter sinensis]|uniref:VPLPA-CTERM sorting domain-containing protein n=1 Tax=Roseobacter sinensis TaxID=2931391 RepID=A0ABT3BF06_9RHOB|nr:VPLPA-CTERM sorting domain-containing protein [Roseobacter sp. WL0113]MCV3272171.1 VPLPA-CTERM sorting domain-containing protein [Roseobacter sp. WL0113]
MNTFLKAAAIAATTVVGAQAASAATLTLDFEGLTANQALTSVTVGTTTFNITTSVSEAILFDTLDNTTSDHVGDPDIIPAVQGENGVGGNVLILREDGSNPLANDRAGGGTITFTLASGPDLALIGASGIDDDTWNFAESFAGALGTLTLGGESETGTVSFLPSFMTVGSFFTIEYEGSGAIDSLVFDDGLTPVPVPAALPLMLAGLGGLGVMARRRKTRKS